MKLMIVAAILLVSNSLCEAQVNAEVREGKVLLFTNEPVDITDLDLVSPAGRLIPVPDKPVDFAPDSVSPFYSFRFNTPNQISWKTWEWVDLNGIVSRGIVTLDGSLNTKAGYEGDPTGDLTGTWRNGTVGGDISVSASSELIPESIREPDPILYERKFAEIREGNVLLVTRDLTRVSGFQLESPAGNLIPVDERLDLPPLTFLEENTPNRIAWGNLERYGFRVDTLWNTNAGYNGDPAGDLVVTACQNQLKTRLSDQPLPPGFQAPNLSPPHRPITPNDAVFGEIRESELLLFTTEPVEMRSIRITSAAQNLEPIDNRIGPAPFNFAYSNQDDDVTLINVRGTSTVDGAYNTNVSLLDPALNDLVGFYVNEGGHQEYFPITISDERIPPGAETTYFPFSRPPVPHGDSSVIAEVRDGTIVLVSDEPVEASYLLLDSQAGNLRPKPVDDASPFDSYLRNNRQRIGLTDDTSITIDRILDTGVGYTGDPSGDLSGVLISSESIQRLPVSNPGAPDPPIQPDPGEPNGPAEEQATVFAELREGRLLLLTDGPIFLSQLSVRSEEGELVPVDDRIGPAPFYRLRENNEQSVFFHGSVWFDGVWNTNVGYSGDIDDLVVDYIPVYKEPAVDIPVTLSDEPIPHGMETPDFPWKPEFDFQALPRPCPEPSTNSLAWLALVGTIGWVRQRNQSQRLS